MIDGDDEAARKERLEESDRWIPTFTRSKSSKTLKLPQTTPVAALSSERS